MSNTDNNRKLFNDVAAFAPQNWTTLAQVAKFLRATYNEDVQTDLKAILRAQNRDIVELVKPRVADNQALNAEATCVYWGAKAFAIEGSKTKFRSTKQRNDNIDRALIRGLLVKNFVEAARSLTRADDSNMPSVCADKALTGLHEKSKAIFESVKDSGPFLTLPKADTIVRLIKEENGLLPAPVERALRVATAQLKP